MTPTYDTTVRVWQVLISAAHHGAVVSEAELAELVGAGTGEVADALQQVGRYCTAREFPPLPALVQSNPASPADAERQRVFAQSWFRQAPLTAAELEAADLPPKRACPRCGRPGNAQATLCGYCWEHLTPAGG